MKKKSTIQDLLECNFAGKLSGARASNRLNFQQSWSLMKLLQIHSQRHDYRAVFDFAEDFILYCDSTDFPSEGEFYQIKTDDDKKSFSISNLTNQRTIRKKSDNSDVIKKSFLEKLFENKKLFSNVKVNLYFIANIPFNLKLTDPTRDSKSSVKLQLSELHNDELEKIIKKLGSTFDINFYKDTAFEVSSLSLDHEERDKTLLAELANLIEQLHPARPYIAGPILKTISSEVMRKSNFEKNPSDLIMFYKKKTFSKEEFDKIIVDGISLTNPRDKWLEIQPLLVADGVTSGEVLALKVAYMTLARLFVEDSLETQKLIKKIQRILLSVDKKEKSLKQIVDACLEEYNRDLNDFSNTVNEDVIKALVLNEAV